MTSITCMQVMVDFRQSSQLAIRKSTSFVIFRGYIRLKVTEINCARLTRKIAIDPASVAEKTTRRYTRKRRHYSVRRIDATRRDAVDSIRFDTSNQSINHAKRARRTRAGAMRRRRRERFDDVGEGSRGDVRCRTREFHRRRRVVVVVVVVVGKSSSSSS